MADGSPELDVSMVQPRRTCSALALLGVIFSHVEVDMGGGKTDTLVDVHLYSVSSCLFSIKADIHIIHVQHLQKRRTSKQAALVAEQ